MSISNIGQTGAVQDLQLTDDTEASPPKTGSSDLGSTVQAYAEGSGQVHHQQPPRPDATDTFSVKSDGNSSPQSMNFGFVLGKVFELLAGLFGAGGGGNNSVKNNPLDGLSDGIAPHKKKNAKHALESVDDDQKKPDGAAGKDPTTKGTPAADTSDVKTPNDTPPTDGPGDVDDTAGAGDVIDDQVSDDSSMVA